MNECRSDKRDVKNAVVLWISMMTVYAFMGVIQVHFDIYLAFWVNIVFAGICIGMVLNRKQRLSSIGFQKEAVWYSCKIGLICSGVIVIFNGILPGILRGNELAPPESILLWLLYYMFIIALPEEIIFRGYLLTRLENAIRSSKKAVIISGVLFMLIHAPYQLIVSGLNPVSWLINGNLFTLFMTFVWHLIFCWIFKKTGALYGVILFHGFMDWSNVLFR